MIRGASRFVATNGRTKQQTKKEKSRQRTRDKNKIVNASPMHDEEFLPVYGVCGVLVKHVWSCSREMRCRMIVTMVCIRDSVCGPWRCAIRKAYMHGKCPLESRIYSYAVCLHGRYSRARDQQPRYCEMNGGLRLLSGLTSTTTWTNRLLNSQSATRANHFVKYSKLIPYVVASNYNTTCNDRSIG